MNLFLILVAFLSSAFAVTPMAPRTPSNPYVLNEEYAKVLPPNGCRPDTGCVTVSNWGSTMMIPQNQNASGPARVVDGDGYTVGIFLNGLPTIVGWTQDVTTGRTIPILDGEFVSIIDACVRSGSQPKTYVRVGPVNTVTFTGTSVMFYAEPGADQVALDARTGVVIKYHPGYGQIAGQVAPVIKTLRNASGVVLYGNPYYIALGDGTGCQS